MEIETTEQAWTRNNPCAIVIVKNASYMESVRLLQEDIAEDESRGIYLAVGESELYDDSQDDAQAAYFAITVPLPLDEDSEYLYGASLIIALRMSPDIVITEDCVNYPATTIDDKVIYPLDTMIVESMSGSSVAMAIEATSIEESIRQLHSKMHNVGRKYLARNLMLAYMDGKRWAITPEIILLALLD